MYPIPPSMKTLSTYCNKYFDTLGARPVNMRESLTADTIEKGVVFDVAHSIRRALLVHGGVYFRNAFHAVVLSLCFTIDSNLVASCSQDMESTQVIAAIPYGPQTELAHVQVLGDAHRARKNWNSTNVVVRVLHNTPYYNCYNACQHMSVLKSFFTMFCHCYFVCLEPS